MFAFIFKFLGLILSLPFALSRVAGLLASQEEVILSISRCKQKVNERTLIPVLPSRIQVIFDGKATLITTILRVVAILTPGNF